MAYLRDDELSPATSTAVRPATWSASCAELASRARLGWVFPKVSRPHGAVQAWMGHESIATTNRYLRVLGTGADLAGLERLSSTPGVTGGHLAGFGRGRHGETPPDL
jgi:integrase